jgi:DNA repair exonuclease SbcCD ATPase subunit
VLKNPLTQSIQVLEAKITQLKGDLEKAQEQTRLAESRASNIESVLKKQLIDLIASHEHQIETSLAALSQRLSEREADLTAVKKLFVDKLRELESSFVELDQNLIDTEAA